MTSTAMVGFGGLVNSPKMSVLLPALTSLLTAGILAALGYLAKDKLETIESKLDDVDNGLDDIEQEMEDEHEVMAGWLGRLTEEVEGVQPPEEVEETTRLGEWDRKE